MASAMISLYDRETENIADYLTDSYKYLFLENIERRRVGYCAVAMCNLPSRKILFFLPSASCAW
jgi:hypothetical protein